ncbi:MAG: YHYH protein [Bacteroidetes bacterium]|nr:YHYH protein [Bacteroidota bacterium]
MRKTLLLFLSVFFLQFSHAQSPEITSWILNTDSSKGYNNILSNVQMVQYSANNVYVSSTCIPGYDIGPWAGNPNTPANQNFVFKITRNPQKNTGTLIATNLGHIGIWTNGVSIFNPKDAMSYNNQGVWNQNAIVVEGPSFDDCLGHPAPNGEYHHHLNPTCLYNDSNATVHSPIIGFAFDGFPIYGAYGYSDTQGGGGIRRMQSSYHKRNITKRTTLPGGAAASSAGPDVSGTYPIGYYIEDFEYIKGSGDLDEHNGRFCKTPEYPQGMYCYFVTLDSNLIAEYPYVLGTTYYGTVQSGNTGPGSGHNTISESVTVYNGTNQTRMPESNAMRLFPNPAGEKVVLWLENGMPSNLKLELRNSSGTLVFSQDFIQPMVSNTLDLKELAPGMYHLSVFSGSMRWNRTLQIQ